MTPDVANLTNCTFSGNAATTSGGGAYNASMLTVNGGNLNSNSASFGGAIYNDTAGTLAGTLTVTGSTLTGNTLDGSGSGGAVYNSRGRFTLSSSTVSSNGGGNFAGGVYNFQGTLAFDSDSFDSNSANISGGSIFSNGTATISNSSITNSYATDGGGIFSNGTLILTTTTLDSDSAYPDSTGAGGFGGGIDDFTPGQCTVMNCTLSNNNAVSGAGIYVDRGRLTVNDSTLTGNNAYTNNGGGIDNLGTVTVSNATLSGNPASNNGGGISNESGGILTLTNSIVAGNFAGGNPDYSGLVAPASSNNLIGDGTGLSGISNGTNGNQIGTSDSPIDPMLGSLSNNGGPTLTFALQSGSPALGAGGPSTTLNSDADVGDTTLSVVSVAGLAITPGLTIQIDSEQMTITAVNSSTNTFTVLRGVNGTTAASHAQGANLYPATDQRGSPRVVNGSIDLGAYQTQPMAPLPGGRGEPTPTDWSAWAINDYLFSQKMKDEG
jgi:hypothetical protein